MKKDGLNNSIEAEYTTLTYNKISTFLSHYPGNLKLKKYFPRHIYGLIYIHNLFIKFTATQQ